MFPAWSFQFGFSRLVFSVWSFQLGVSSYEWHIFKVGFRLRVTHLWSCTYSCKRGPGDRKTCPRLGIAHLQDSLAWGLIRMKPAQTSCSLTALIALHQIGDQSFSLPLRSEGDRICCCSTFLCCYFFLSLFFYETAASVSDETVKTIWYRENRGYSES